MVLLTMTPAIVEGIKKLESLSPEDPLPQGESEPTAEPAVSNPISHSQVVNLWKRLTAKGYSDYGLESLLVGSRVFIPPPPPKPEPSDEYKALMARLRREEEARAYERMVNPPAPVETFSQLFTDAKSFAAANKPQRESDIGDNDVTLNDVHRQLVLILNFVVSIVGVAGTLWVLARWWSTTARVLLALGGSIVIGIAEVGLYYFYIWHLVEASKKDKKQDKTFKERKQVVQTWVIEGAQVTSNKAKTALEEKDIGVVRAVRRRKKA